MSEVLKALFERNSHGKLVEPGPSKDDLALIVKAGLRAPDHARLRPWHFVAVEGERREALAEVFVQSLMLSNPEATEADIKKARCATLRAPLILCGLLKPKEHPKVPRVEQVGAVASALHAMLLAAEALGYAAMWRTGPYSQDPLVIKSLGGKAGDEVIGFLYIGTACGNKKLVPEDDPMQYLSYF